jgi:hypothetical protein
MRDQEAVVITIATKEFHELCRVAQDAADSLAFVYRELNQGRGLNKDSVTGFRYLVKELDSLTHRAERII